MFFHFFSLFDGAQEESQNRDDKSKTSSDDKGRRNDARSSSPFLFLLLPRGDLLPRHAGRVLQPQAGADPEDARLRLRLR